MPETTGRPTPTLSGLVERYSPSGQEAEAVAFLVGHMQGLGYTGAFSDEDLETAFFSIDIDATGSIPRASFADAERGLDSVPPRVWLSP